MPVLRVHDPVRVLLPTGIQMDYLKSLLTFKDKKVEYALKRLRANAAWRVKQMGQEAYEEEYKRLSSEKTKTLIFKDLDDRLWTYTGLLSFIQKYIDNLSIESSYKRPEPSPIPWEKMPKTPRPYQIMAYEKLIEKGHANVEMGTGLGKSYIILNISRNLGLKTIIMAPSVSIAGQLYNDHVEYLGPKYVGAYFDNKKQSNKLITIATAQSLTRIQSDSKAWKDLSSAEVFIADESHLTPAETLSKVCLGTWIPLVDDSVKWSPGLAANAKWRFFFSGTQLRNDGLDLLLRGIIGDTVYTMTVRDGVDQGYLARPHFRMVNLESKINYSSKDPNSMTRVHLYENPAVGMAAGQLASKFAKSGRKVLIMIEELGQVMPLISHINTRFGLAHGGVTQDQLPDQAKNVVGKKGNASKLPQELWKSDPDSLVQEFNAGQLPILIGTSCIGTGTDIRPPGPMVIIYLAGGRSEIQVRQYVGRGTRIEGKTDFLFIDFDITNVEVLHRHANDRRAIYEDIYEAPKDIFL